VNVVYTKFAQKITLYILQNGIVHVVTWTGHCGSSIRAHCFGEKNLVDRLRDLQIVWKKNDRSIAPMPIPIAEVSIRPNVLKQDNLARTDYSLAHKFSRCLIRNAHFVKFLSFCQNNTLKYHFWQLFLFRVCWDYSVLDYKGKIRVFYVRTLVCIS
jgi:hypothetical protein